MVVLALLAAILLMPLHADATPAAGLMSRNGHVTARATMGSCEVETSTSAPASPPAPLDWTESAAANLNDHPDPYCSGVPDEASSSTAATIRLVLDLQGGLREVRFTLSAQAAATDSPQTPPTAFSSANAGATVQFVVHRPVSYSFNGSTQGSWRNEACFDVCGGASDGILEPGAYTVRAKAHAGDETGSGTATVTLTVGASLGERFDWSAPDRYGQDPDGDGFIDSFEPDGPLDPTPDGFRIDFTDGVPSACDASLRRVWWIDDTEVLPTDPRIIRYNPSSCEFSYSFAEEGTYRVTLDVFSGTTRIDQVTKDVLVQDWVIVSLGDSVASGEGVPDKPLNLVSGRAAQWQNRQCHRSALAGPAVAARRLEVLDPKTTVTFVHLACSGATVDQGLLGPYQGIEPGAPLDPQIQAMRELLGDREIDAVLISIGANDVRFATIVEKCLQDEPCYDFDNPTSAASLFESLVVSLPGKYDDVAAALAEAEDPVPATRVMLTEYFDPTRDEYGSACDGEMLTESVPLPIRAAAYPHLSITAFEALWASENMLTRLNAAGSSATSRHGWQRVTGPFASFRNHGYCAPDHWVVQLSESAARQFDRYGTLHPNVSGHAIGYAPPISSTLRNSLYLGGDLTKPRNPE